MLVALLFVIAAVMTLSAAEPFGGALVDTGDELGINRFLLVQWLAPIASESPEVLVAITFALRARADDGMGALLAAKLNQWTLLVACLPEHQRTSHHRHDMGQQPESDGHQRSRLGAGQLEPQEREQTELPRPVPPLLQITGA